MARCQFAERALASALSTWASTRPGEPATRTTVVPVRIAVCLTTVLLPPAVKVISRLHCSSPSWGAAICCVAMSIGVLPTTTWYEGHDVMASKDPAGALGQGRLGVAVQLL